MIKINEPAIDFEGDAFVDREIKKINLNDFKGNYSLFHSPNTRSKSNCSST